jgi:hypothetical protein
MEFFGNLPLDERNMLRDREMPDTAMNEGGMVIN